MTKKTNILYKSKTKLTSAAFFCSTLIKYVNVLIKNVHVSNNYVNVLVKNVQVSNNYVNVLMKNVHVSNNYVNVLMKNVHVLNNYVNVLMKNVHVSNNYVNVSIKNVHVSINNVHVSIKNVHISINNLNVLMKNIKVLIETFADIKELQAHISGLSDALPAGKGKVAFLSNRLKEIGEEINDLRVSISLLAVRYLFKTRATEIR